VDILRHLEPDAATDADLLAGFLRRDEAAFAKLVRRHGPMILGVCRRITRHAEDAEDAFQAVFLILAKKAGSVRDPHLLGNWLYGVAARVAQKARRGSVRRRAREVQTVNAPEPPAPPVTADDELGAALHEELAKLPAKFREPIVLCDLRGITRTQAAHALGIAVGTLHSRLSAGREKLARQLNRRGIAMAAAMVPAALADGVAAAGLPDSLLAKTCGLVAGWQAGAAIPAAVLRLTHGVFPMRMTLLVGMMGAVLATAGVVMATRPDDPKPSDPPKSQAPAAKGPPVAAPEAKEEAFTTKPRLRHSIDLRIKDASDMIWSPDGKRMAIVGTVAYGNEGTRVVLIHEIGADAPSRMLACTPPSELIGFTSDSKQVIVALQEYSLVSGRHQLQYWPAQDKPKAPQYNGMYWKPDRTVDLGSEPTHQYAFAADGKSFRTLFVEGGVSPEGTYGPIEVREFSTENGKLLRTLMTVDKGTLFYLLSANGKRLVTVTLGGIDVWNVDEGKKESSPRFEPIPRAFSLSNGRSSIRLSDDSRYLLIVHAGVPHIFDNETGKFLPKLEIGTEIYPSVTPAHCFSSRNQLLVMSGQQQFTMPGNQQRRFADFIKVWEVKSGKLLKSWPHHPHAAWSPIAPVLAVIESNGKGGTRLGLWDFASEPRP